MLHLLLLLCNRSWQERIQKSEERIIEEAKLLEVGFLWFIENTNAAIRKFKAIQKIVKFERRCKVNTNCSDANGISNVT